MAELDLNQNIQGRNNPSVSVYAFIPLLLNMFGSEQRR